MERVELIQRRGFGQEQRFLLGDEGDVRVATRRPGSVRAYRVDLEELDASPERVRERALGWLATTFALATVSLVLAVLAMLGAGPAGVLLGTAFATALGAAVAARLYFRSSVDVLAFCNRYTGQARLALWHGLPDQASSVAFVETLISRIRAVHGRPGDLGDGSIASELRQLQMLVEEGALSHEEFEHTKRRLLGLAPEGAGREGLH